MKIFNKVFFISLSFLFLGLILSHSAFAVDRDGRRPSGTPGAEGRLKSCQERENALKLRSEALTKMVATMMEKFDTIAQRVEDYYTTKVLPSSKSVVNYDSLVADIATKKATVQTVLTTAQNDLATFNCDGANPKNQMMKFREDMQAVKQALKVYRTAIKNLIVAVHSVTGTENRANPSHSPRPTKLPNQEGTNQQ